MSDPLNFEEIRSIIESAYLEQKNIEVYYSKTENTPEGWREIRIESITTDIPPQGEELLVGKDVLSPGHIINAYDVNAKNGKIRSFIMGKIKSAKIL